MAGVNMPESSTYRLCARRGSLRLLQEQGIVCRMSRRGNCHNNAVADSLSQLSKRERLRRHVYPTQTAARVDVFDYIEMLCNPKRRHGSNGGVSPAGFKARFAESGC